MGHKRRYYCSIAFVISWNFWKIFCIEGEDKSVLYYCLSDSSCFNCGLSVVNKSLMEQLSVIHIFSSVLNRMLEVTPLQIFNILFWDIPVCLPNQYGVLPCSSRISFILSDNIWPPPCWYKNIIPKNIIFFNNISWHIIWKGV